MPTYTKIFFKLRGLLMAPPMIFLVLCNWYENENHFLVFGLGSLFFAMGLSLRIWAQMHLKYRLRIKTLLTATGPYGVVRNPIYIANAIMLIALCFLSELFWFAPIMLAYVIVIYYLVVRYEESHLRVKYGTAYEQYVTQVPRWLPRWRGDGNHDSSNTRKYFWPSILTECHNLLLLLPVLLKEFLL